MYINGNTRSVISSKKRPWEYQKPPNLVRSYIPPKWHLPNMVKPLSLYLQRILCSYKYVLTKRSIIHAQWSPEKKPREMMMNWANTQARCWQTASSSIVDSKHEARNVFARCGSRCEHGDNGFNGSDCHSGQWAQKLTKSLAELLAVYRQFEF